MGFYKRGVPDEAEKNVKARYRKARTTRGKVAAVRYSF